MKKRKWDSYRSGEELFGLAVTQYEGLETTKQELGLLVRLYRCLPWPLVTSWPSTPPGMTHR